MNSKEENSHDFCPICVLEFGLRCSMRLFTGVLPIPNRELLLVLAFYCISNRKSFMCVSVEQKVSQRTKTFFPRETIKILRSMVLHLWCGVARLVAPPPALRQVRVRFSARHDREVFPLSFQAMKRWRETPANGDGYMCCINVIE